MTTKVEVMPEREFEAWYKGESTPTAGTQKLDGAMLVHDKGCIACHSLDGTQKVGPTLKGLLGRKETVVTAGKEQKITVDEAYIRRSIREPQADIVKGFPSIMPSPSGVLKDDEVEAIVEYLKTL